MKHVKFCKLSKQNFALAKKFVSHTLRYGEQISLPIGFTFNNLLSELSKTCGNRQIEFFEVMVGKRIAGFCYYTIYERYRAAEIAAIFLPEFRGQGLALPTISFLKEHIIHYYPKLIRIEATASSCNPIAISTLLSGGFKIEGIRPAGYVRGKIISDAILFGMLIGKKRIVSSLYHFDCFKNKKKEKFRLMKQGQIVLTHEAKLLHSLGIWDRFANAEQIIDIGCGFGQFIDWLANEFPSVKKIIGVDNSESMIRGSIVRDRKKVRLVCSEGLKFLKHLSSRKADIICLRFVINHIPVSSWNHWLLNIKRCLKPGGIVYITLADANYYKTYPELPLMDIMFEHKKLVREKAGGIWNVPSVIGAQLHAAGYRGIIQQSVCITTEDMGKHNYAVSIGDQFLWGIEKEWDKTGKMAKDLLLDASRHDNFWGQVKIGVHVGEKP